MKSIEERAKDYAPDAFDADLILPAREGYIVKVQRDAYIQGATEQKAIDIDRAIKVHCSFCEAHNTCIDRGSNYCHETECIRKALEE